MANKVNIRKFLFDCRTSLSFLLRTMLSFLFGEETCLACGKRVYGSSLCTRCGSLFVGGPEAFSTAQRCPYCGRLLVSELGVCMECREQRVISGADSVFALHPYRLWYKNLLFAWKMQGQRALCLMFAEAVMNFLRHSGCMTVVPVPPRPGKIRVKGWDQIDDVCNVLKMRYGVRIVHALTRLSSDQQKKKDRAGRLSGSLSFALDLKNPGQPPEEAVLLDDVITTGATVQECSLLLKSYGIRKVAVLSLFIVD